MTNVLGVVGARLNSSRLPRKQLLELAGEPLVSRIFQRLEQIPEIDRLVLATTADDYNRPLLAWAEAAGRECFAFGGDVDDLVGRVDALVQRYRPGIVVYFCGDSPLIEPATLSRLIQALQQNPQIGRVELRPDSAGRRAIHEGFNVYPLQTWQRLVAACRTPHHREHVGSSLIDEKLPTLALPEREIFYRLEHRLSVDTPSDYRFMAELYRRWYRSNGAGTIVSLPWVIETLEGDEALRAVNAEVKQKGVLERSIKTLIVVQCGRQVGLGHFARMVVLCRALQDRVAAAVELLIQGEPFSHPALQLLPHRFVAADADLEAEVTARLAGYRADAVVFDLANAATRIAELAGRLQRQGVVTVAVDGALLQWPGRFDIIHIPSFYLADEYRPLQRQGHLGYGWDHYLIAAGHPSGERARTGRRRVLVLTGGSDVAGLAATWPALLERQLPAGSEVVWVRGRYAGAPAIPASARLAWRCVENSTDLAALMGEADYALSLYGVSFFELLQQGVPCMTWAPDARLAGEMAALADEAVALVATSAAAAVDGLAQLMTDEALAARLGRRARQRMAAGNGAQLLARRIAARVAQR